MTLDEGVCKGYDKSSDVSMLQGTVQGLMAPIVDFAFCAGLSGTYYGFRILCRA